VSRVQGCHAGLAEAEPGAVLRRIVIANADSPVPKSLSRNSFILCPVCSVSWRRVRLFLSSVKNSESNAHVSELSQETFQKTYSVTHALFGS